MSFGIFSIQTSSSIITPYSNPATAVGNYIPNGSYSNGTLFFDNITNILYVFSDGVWIKISSGNTGPTGPQSNITGPMGQIGYTGYTGFTGPTGVQSNIPGPTGPQGMLDVSSIPNQFLSMSNSSSVSPISWTVWNSINDGITVSGTNISINTPGTYKFSAVMNYNLSFSNLYFQWYINGSAYGQLGVSNKQPGTLTLVESTDVIGVPVTLSLVVPASAVTIPANCIFATVELVNPSAGYIYTGPTGPAGIGLTGTIYGQTINWNNSTNSWQLVDENIALGAYAGEFNQGTQSVAIGFQAGATNQGNYCIAIGSNAGVNNQSNNSIIFNASSGPLNTISSGFFVNPINQSESLSGTYGMAYNPTTSEVMCNNAKTFVIQHPLHENKYLIHACLEGPEAGVYYRGDGKLSFGICKIDLPYYAKNLAYSWSVQLTPIDTPRLISSSRVKDGYFVVNGDKSDNGEFFWLVHGTRLEIEIEPCKENTKISGDGPYTYCK